MSDEVIEVGGDAIDAEVAEFESAFSDAVGDDVDFDAGKAVAVVENEKAQGQSKQELAEQSAAMYCELAATLVNAKWQYLDLSDSKEQIQPKLAAVLAKYDAELPAWLAPFKEEVALGIAVGVAGFTCYMQVQAVEAAKKAEADNAKSQSSSTQ